MRKFYALYEQIVLEARRDALLKWKDYRDVKEIIDKYLKEVRHKVNPPINNIDWWHKNKTYEQFKDFVVNYVSKSAKDKKVHTDISEIDGAKRIDIIEGYEVWKVESYKACRFLGRFYKNLSTSWCISTDNDHYWNSYYIDDDYRIYFLIKQQITDRTDIYNKIAILRDDSDKIAIKEALETLVYDMEDNEYTDFSIIPMSSKGKAKINSLCKWYKVKHSDYFEKYERDMVVDSLIDHFEADPENILNLVKSSIDSKVYNTILKWIKQNESSQEMRETLEAIEEQYPEEYEKLFDAFVKFKGLTYDDQMELYAILKSRDTLFS